jgi:hypothetical protein
LSGEQQYSRPSREVKSAVRPEESVQKENAQYGKAA